LHNLHSPNHAGPMIARVLGHIHLALQHGRLLGVDPQAEGLAPKLVGSRLCATAALQPASGRGGGWLAPTLVAVEAMAKPSCLGYIKHGSSQGVPRTHTTAVLPSYFGGAARLAYGIRLGDASRWARLVECYDECAKDSRVLLTYVGFRIKHALISANGFNTQSSCTALGAIRVCGSAPEEVEGAYVAGRRVRAQGMVNHHALWWREQRPRRTLVTLRPKRSL